MHKHPVYRVSVTAACYVCVHLCLIHSLQQCVERLEKEIHLEFSRTMNQMTFDKLVQANPKEFFYITVPEKEPERMPHKG